MPNKIVFHSKRKENIGNQYFPEPSKNYIPDWFSSADKHRKHKSGLYELIIVNNKGKQILERVPSWKSCPSILDSFLSGYTLKTPVDIVIKKVDGEPTIINQEECGYFCSIRGYQDGFPTPDGYESLQLTWITNWMPQVPEGYTTLWTHPLNRFDLPFISISGFIDTESYIQKGKLPFFIKKDFEGVIPAGTAFVQIFPIKNEDWKMDLRSYSKEEIEQNDELDLKTYVPEGNNKANYKSKFWVKKRYE